jgi:hypothetical protein
MLGNLQGWIISLFIALGGGYVLWLGSRPPHVSEPSGIFPNLLGKVATPVDPRSVSPVPMTAACDAGEKYRAAINEFLANKAQYEQWHSKANEAVTAKPKAVELLVDAADCGRMSLFTKTPAEVVTYDSEPATLDAMEKLGGMAVQRGMLLRKTQPDVARRYLAAAFALGSHLYEERIAWREFVTGVNLMTDSARYLAQLEPDPGRARALETFADSAEKYKQEQVKLYGVLATADGPTIGRHGGDAYALARSSPEPMWRTSAILAIGRMKYNTPSRGDQLAAPRELQVWVTDPDPAVRAAAKAASDLTLQQYRMLR